MYIGIKKPMLKYNLEEILSYKKEILTESQEAEDKLQQGHEMFPLFLSQPECGSWINRAEFYSKFATL